MQVSISFKFVLVTEAWITTCGSKLIYDLLPGKEVVYVLPITSILGKLPLVSLQQLNSFILLAPAGAAG